MKNLMLTLSQRDSLVINDAEVVINILEITGKNRVKVKILAKKNIALNRGKIYLSKKITETDLCSNGYINTPLFDLLDENNEKMIDLLEQTHEYVKNKDWKINVNLPEKTLNLLSVVGEDGYHKIIELFLAKYLYVNNAELTDEVVLEFKKDFLGYKDIT